MTVDDERAERLRVLRWQVFVTCWLSYAGFYCTRKVFSVVKGPIKDALEVDDVGVSYLFTTYLVAYAAGQFLSAWLSRRVSLRTQLLAGMLTSVACNLAMGALLPLGPSMYGAILVVMGVHGLAQATGWPCNVGIMAAWTRHKERGRVMAVWGTCYQLGAVFAKLLASFLFGVLGLAWSFWGAAVVLALVTGLFWLWVRDKPEAHGYPPLEEEPPPAPKGSAQETQEKQALRRQLTLVFAMGVIYFAFKFLRYVVDSWSALIASERFTLSTEHAGYVSTAFDWVGFLGVLFAGWLSDKLDSRVRVIAMMSVGLVIATTLMWTVGDTGVVMFCVLLGMIGFMEMGPDSLLSGVGAIETGSRRTAALAAGIINGCGSLGPIVQEPVVGWLKQTYGADSVWLLLIGMTVAASVGVGVFWLGVRRAGVKL